MKWGARKSSRLAPTDLPNLDATQIQAMGLFGTALPRLVAGLSLSGMPGSAMVAAEPLLSLSSIDILHGPSLALPSRAAALAGLLRTSSDLPSAALDQRDMGDVFLAPCPTRRTVTLTKNSEYGWATATAGCLAARLEMAANTANQTRSGRWCPGSRLGPCGHRRRWPSDPSSR